MDTSLSIFLTRSDHFPSKATSLDTQFGILANLLAYLQRHLKVKRHIYIHDFSHNTNVRMQQNCDL